MASNVDVAMVKVSEMIGNMPKILCVLPEVPFPANSGGKQAMLNHMHLLNDTTDCHFVIFDVDSDRYPHIQSLISDGFSIDYFPRLSPKLANGFGGKLNAVFDVVFSLLPRTCSVRKNPHLAIRLKELIQASRYDAVIFEHISSCHFLLNLPRTNSLLVYYSQNNETKSSHDAAKSNSSVIIKLALWFDYVKTTYFEKKVLKKADLVIALSDQDAVYFKSLIPASKVEYIPEAYSIPNISWKLETAGLGILFIGAPSHAPNRDALEWLITSLAPILYSIRPSVFINIVGSNARDFPSMNIPKNIRFHGRVPSHVLDELYCTCSLSISPIELGSGIKIKVLEALAYGIPLACTKASLTGITFLDELFIPIILDRTNPAQAANDIAEFCSCLSPAHASQAMQNREIMKSKILGQKSMYLEVLTRHRRIEIS